MDKTGKNAFTLAGIPLLGTGAAFLAVGAAGQPAFGYAGAGLLIPGVLMLLVGAWGRRRA